MKKTCIAASLLLAYAASAQAQSSVTIYGIMDAGASYNTKVASGTATGRVVGITSGLRQASRWGLRGSEDLGGGLSATFGLEQGISLDTGAGGTFTATESRAWSRRSTVGLSSKSYGLLDLGWRKDALDEIGNAYGSVLQFGTFILKGSANNLNRASGGSRANNMVYVNTPTFGGFKANFSLGLGETTGNWEAGRAFGGAVNYASGIFGVGAGYWRSQRGTGNGTTSSDQAASSSVGCNGAIAGTAAGDVCLETWSIGASVNPGPVVVRGMYSLVEHPLVRTAGPAAPAFTTTFTSGLGTGAFTSGGSNNTKGQVIDLSVDYKVTPSATLRVSFIDSRYDFLGATSEGKVRQLSLGGDYFLSKRTTLYITAAGQSADAMYTPGILGSVGPGRDNTATAVGAGIRHIF